MQTTDLPMCYVRMILLFALSFSASIARANTVRASSDQDVYSLAAEAVGAATEAYTSGDHAAFREHMITANKYRPDHPTYRYYLAAAHAKNGDAANAAMVLHEIARHGLYVPAADEEDFQSVASFPDVQAAFSALAVNLESRGQIEIAHSFPAHGGLWEGVAWDSAGKRLFLSDLHLSLIHI